MAVTNCTLAFSNWVISKEIPSHGGDFALSFLLHTHQIPGMATVSDTSMTRTLAQAAHVLGGIEALAEKLGVTTEQLRGWLAGASEAPAAIYVRALDILIAASKLVPR